MSDPTDSGDAFAKLQSRLAGDLRPVRPFAPGRRMLLFLALFAPLTAMVLWRIFGWRSDQAALDGSWMWGLSLVELTAAFVILNRVMREAVPGRSSSLALLTFTAVGAVVLHVAVNLATFAQSRIYPAPGLEWTVGLYCFAFEFALGVPCLLFALWLGRRGLTARPRRLGVLGGIGAGLAADADWRLICPYSEPAHAFGSHSLGILAVVGLGLILAGWWESGRTRARRAEKARARRAEPK